MAFSGTTYNNVAGATTAAPGQTVQSAVWNNIHTDLATALTQVMSQVVSIVSFKNILAANGSFDVWQRGAGSSASFAVGASTTQYTADRWYITTGANEASTVAAATNLTNNSLLACTVNRNSGQTGTTAYVFGYPLDSEEVQRIRGNKVTFSAVVKAGANWSPASGTLTSVVFVGTGTPQKAGAAAANFTTPTTVLSISTNLTAGGGNTAISGSSSAVVPVSATQGEVQFTWTPVATAGAVDTLFIDDVQLENDLSSTTWTPSQYDRIPLEMQLELCKRHYISTFNYGTLPAQAGGQAGSLQSLGLSTTQKSAIFWAFPVEMRTTPTITTFNPTVTSANWQDHTTSVSVLAVVDASAPGTKGVFITTSVTTSMAANDLLYIQAQADAGL